MSAAKAAGVETAPADVQPVPVNGAVAPAFLDRASILAANDLKSEVVEVPEWGGSVIVRGLTGTERDSFEEAMTSVQGKSRVANLRNFRSKLCARAMVDGNGDRLFTDADADALGKKSAAALQRIFEVAQRLAGLSPDDVDELTEALKDDPNAGSGSV